jgi:hypothetical protein
MRVSVRLYKEGRAAQREGRGNKNLGRPSSTSAPRVGKKSVGPPEAAATVDVAVETVPPKAEAAATVAAAESAVKDLVEKEGGKGLRPRREGSAR